ncbi:sulfatase-like hydrolase/transferase [bacterium]|nr:sulfatase-like hydrolase/transferase [bacterium]
MKRNLLLIVTDCARAEKTIGGVAGGDQWTARTAPLPWLDALRERGTTWSRYCSVSSTTTPNFATMFTGLSPAEHGIVEHSRHTLRDVTTLAETLSARGYHTVAEMTGPLVPESGLGRGFHEYRHRPRTNYLDAGFGEEVGRRVRELPSPWFLCLHLWEAHAPYRNPRAFATNRSGMTPYDRALAAADDGLARALSGVNPADTTIVYCGDHGERLEEDYARNATLGGDEQRVLECFRRHVASAPPPLDYAAWFATASRELGEIPARIYAHNVLGHGFHLTEELIRVPLVVVDGDRCEPGSERQEVRSQLDLFATLLDLAGTEPPDDRGTSLLEDRPDVPIYIEANGSGGKAYASRCYLRGARTSRWKYWRVEGASTTHEVLWDLDADPRETVDVSEVYPDVTAELSRFTDGWTERRGAGKAAELSEAEEAVLEGTLKELGYL